MRMILWPHTRGWTLPCVIAMMADSVAIHSFLVLAFYNLIARYKYVSHYNANAECLVSRQSR